MMTYHGNVDLSKYRVLVTGGAGFIGSHLVDYLVEHGAGLVRVADNLATGNVVNIKKHIDSRKIEFLETDISKPKNAALAVTGINVVFHQAAFGSVPRSVEFPANTHQANVNGYFNLIEAARQEGIKHFIYASSSSVFGDNTNFPRTEGSLGQPMSPYAVTKRVNELYGQVYHRMYGMHTTGLRYFNIFGPRQNPEGPYAAAIPRFIIKMLKGEAPVIFGDGSQTRDFTYVENAVQANIRALVSMDAAGDIFNIGLGREASLNDLTRDLQKLIPGAPDPIYKEIRKGDVSRSMAEITHARKNLGYKPIEDFNMGLEKTVNWFKYGEF